MILSDRFAIVTGAARGIGLALAARLCQAGAQVMLADVNAGDLDHAVAAIKQAQPDATCAGVVTDVTSRESTQAMIAAAISAFGRVDILVNNAGIQKSLSRGPFYEISTEE